MTPRVAPYPYASWPRLSRRAARALSRHLSRSPLASAGVAAAAGELLGRDVRLLPGTPALVEAPRALDAGPVCVVMDAAEGARALLTLGLDAAHELVDRVLGGEGSERAPGDPLELDDLSRGVLGYLVARLLAAESTGYMLHAVADPTAAAELAAGTDRLMRWPATLVLSARRHPICLWLSLRSLTEAPPPLPTPGLRPALAGLSLDLVAHAEHLWLKRSELASLAPGDAVVLDRCQLGPSAGGYRGGLELHLHGARRTRYRGELNGGGIVLSAIDHGQEADMGRGEPAGEGDDDQDAVREVAGDAPVELCVELARFSLPLQELMALRVGQVLTTGRPIGERVVLRAGDRALASGELVDVEGEIGVRLIAVASDSA